MSTFKWSKSRPKQIFYVKVIRMKPTRCPVFPSQLIIGLLSIFKDHFICRSVASNNYSSFELQLFVLELGDPLLIAVIYRPPKFNTNVLTEFAEFLGDVTPKYDKLLVLADFNVHVCCMNDHLAKEFTHLLNAFDFSIRVNAPTHKGGHILDLVLLHGLSITDLEVCENGFSDHKTYSLILWPPFSAYYSHY